MDALLESICDPPCDDSIHNSHRLTLVENPEACSKLATVLGRLHNQSVDANEVEAEVGQLVHAFGLDLPGLASVALDFVPKPRSASSYSFFDTFGKDVLTSSISWKLEQSYQAGEAPPDSLHSTVANLISSERVCLEELGPQLRPLPEDLEELVRTRRVVLGEKLESVRPGSGGGISWSETVGGQRQEGDREKDFPRSVLARYHDDFLEGHPALSLAAYYLRQTPSNEVHVKNALALFKNATADSVALKDEALNCAEFREGVTRYVAHAIDETCLGFFGDPFYRNGDARDYWNRGSLLPFLPLDFVFVLGRHFHRSPEACRSLCWVLAYEAKNISNFGRCDGAPREKRRWGDVFDRILFECLLPAHASSHSDELCMEVGNSIDGVLKLLPPSRCISILSRFMDHVRGESPILHSYYRIGKWGPKQVLKRLVMAEGQQDAVLVSAFAKAGKIAPFSVVDELVGRVLHGDQFWIPGYIKLMKDWPSFAFSTLAHVLIDTMTDIRDAKIDQSGFAPWVDSLSNFIVKVCVAYPEQFPAEWVVIGICKEISRMEYGVVKILSAILQQVMGVRADTLIEEFPGSFFAPSGCSDFKNIPRNELDALAGGPLLNGIIRKIPNMQARTNGSVRKRLMDALTRPLGGTKPKAGEFKNHLGILVVFLMKCMEKVPYSVHTSKMSVVMGSTDAVTDAYIQTIAAFTANTSPENRRNMLPTMNALVNKAKCNPYWAFHAYRNTVTELVMKDGASGEGSSLPHKGQGVMDKLVKAVGKFEKFNEDGVWDRLPVEFFTLFWTLSLQDVTVPEKAYKEAKEIIEGKLEACRGCENDSKKPGKPEIEHWKKVLTKLKREHMARKKRVKKVEDYLWKRKDTLLGSVQESKLADLQMALLEHCIWPRVKMGPEEGRFAWEFIVLAGRIGIVNFSVVYLMEKSVKRLLPMMHALTEKEGAGFRVYFNEVMTKANAWRADKSLYQYECGGKHGCKWVPDRDEGAEEDGVETESPRKIEMVDHEKFLRMNYEWNTRTMRILRDFLDPLVEEKQEDYLEPGGEFREKNDMVGHRYILRRSALLLMNNVREIYPLLPGAAVHLVRWASHITEWDRNRDVQSLAHAFKAYMEEQLRIDERWFTLKAFGGSSEAALARERAAEEKEIAEKEDLMEVDEKRGRKHSRDREERRASRHRKSQRVENNNSIFSRHRKSHRGDSNSPSRYWGSESYGHQRHHHERFGPSRRRYHRG
ncbi:hypothetical protein BSKO_03691 [Bryopsis sp. KO-2023]|nr:hypothetical protein BSKO_03691 [Bryopsis sp. KO-2023]